MPLAGLPFKQNFGYAEKERTSLLEQQDLTKDRLEKQKNIKNGGNYGSKNIGVVAGDV